MLNAGHENLVKQGNRAKRARRPTLIVLSYTQIFIIGQLEMQKSNKRGSSPSARLPEARPFLGRSLARQASKGRDEGEQHVVHDG